MPPDAAPAEAAPVPTSPVLPAVEPRLHEVVLAIAAQLAPDRIGTGPLAALRRLDPDPAKGGGLSTPALQRLLWRHVPDAWLAGSDMGQWPLIVHAMALGAPDLHRTFGAQGRLGLALFAAGFSEGRLVRLLESVAADLPTAVPRAVRFLVAKGQGFDSIGLALWVHGIAAGGSRAEAQRTTVARDYYRAERDAGKAA